MAAFVGITIVKEKVPSDYRVQYTFMLRNVIVYIVLELKILKVWFIVLVFNHARV